MHSIYYPSPGEKVKVRPEFWDRTEKLQALKREFELYGTDVSKPAEVVDCLRRSFGLDVMIRWPNCYTLRGLAPEDLIILGSA